MLQVCVCCYIWLPHCHHCFILSADKHKLNTDFGKTQNFNFDFAKSQQVTKFLLHVSYVTHIFLQVKVVERKNIWCSLHAVIRCSSHTLLIVSDSHLKTSHITVGWNGRKIVWRRKRGNIKKMTELAALGHEIAGWSRQVYQPYPHPSTQRIRFERRDEKEREGARTRRN